MVGRFQPFHNGHQALVKAALEDCVEVAVGVGSSNAKPSLRNPFTFDERREMVHAVFPQVQVVPLPDIHDPLRWVDHVVTLLGRVDKVFGNDEASVGLFEDAGIRVVRPGLVERDQFEASTIRMQMAEGDPAWRKAVPAAVSPLLDRFDATKRLRLLEMTRLSSASTMSRGPMRLRGRSIF